MNGNSSQLRKPPEGPNGSTPYASLHPTAAGLSDPKPALSDDRASAAVSATANDFEAEAEKLKQLREALWAAFEAGPAAGLPNTLIDLTMAYTGALRLQLNLRSVSARHVAPQLRGIPAQRAKTHVETSRPE